MKRFLSISFMLLATLIVIVSAVFPHHHHEGLICVVTEVCDSHDLLEHPVHHDADDTNHRSHNCVTESDFITSTNKEEIKCKVCVCHHCTHAHHFAILILISDFLIYEELPVAKPDYGEFIVSYKSINASRTYGLRAPPFFTV